MSSDALNTVPESTESLNKTPKRRGRRAKSSFYHTRLHRVGINEAMAADVLGVSVEDVRRFDAEGAPAMAERLLLAWDRKWINAEGWEKFCFCRGLLYFGDI